MDEPGRLREQSETALRIAARLRAQDARRHARLIADLEAVAAERDGKVRALEETWRQAAPPGESPP